MGKYTFVEMRGDLKSLNNSKNSFIFSTPSLGVAKLNILGHVFNIDIVSCDIPGLIGMDILYSHHRNRVIFRLSLGGRQLMIDDDDIDLLGDRQGHLHLSDNIVKISSSFTQGQSLSKPKTNIFPSKGRITRRTSRTRGPRSRTRTTTRGPPSTAQTQDARQRQVKGNFARH